MQPSIANLNQGIVSLLDALRADPMVAAAVRLSILGFSDTVVGYVQSRTLGDVTALPVLTTRGAANYGTVFDDLLRRIPGDLKALGAEGRRALRPVVLFLTDGRPTDGDLWRESHRQLTDRHTNRFAPMIIAVGIGEATATTVLAVATEPELAFVSAPGVDHGAATTAFCTYLTSTVTTSGRNVHSGKPAPVFEKPEGFVMAIDLV